jgi:hypothetical protein
MRVNRPLEQRTLPIELGKSNFHLFDPSIHVG